MKILHLYANHKWTGPAELALQCVRGLVAGGRDAELAIAGFVHDGMQHAIAPRAQEIAIPVREGLLLRRHFHVPSFRRDARMLARWIDEGSVDLLHAHQPGDHLVAALARGRAKRRIPLVRSLWDGTAPRRSVRTYLAFRQTDALTVPVEGAVLSRGLGVDPSRVRHVPGPLAPEFLEDDAALDGAHAALRHELGVAPDRALVGITARIQARRRWEVLWDLAVRLPENAYLCVLGRPDEGVFEEVCAAPLRARGLTERVHFLGYRKGLAYRRALAAFDAFVFLVPGSDATCRALREAMALGRPVVTTDFGLLPRLVRDGETGFVRSCESGPLAEALGKILGDPDRARSMGESARSAVRARDSAEHAAAQLATLYDELAKGRGPS